MKIPIKIFADRKDMAAVYKQLTKTMSKDKELEKEGGDSTAQNKQRVLLLSTRGITYR